MKRGGFSDQRRRLFWEVPVINCLVTGPKQVLSYLQVVNSEVIAAK